MSDLCTICNGAGCLVRFDRHGITWWPCAYCGSTGVRIQYSPRFINNRYRSLP